MLHLRNNLHHMFIFIFGYPILDLCLNKVSDMNTLVDS